MNVPIETFDDANDVGSDTALRHEVDEAYLAARAGDVGLKNKAVAAVATLDMLNSAIEFEVPAPVVFVAKDGGHARLGIEAREAQPLDSAGAADESGGLAIADQGVVPDLPLRRVVVVGHVRSREPIHPSPPMASAIPAPRRLLRCFVTQSWLE